MIAFAAVEMDSPRPDDVEGVAPEGADAATVVPTAPLPWNLVARDAGAVEPQVSDLQVSDPETVDLESLGDEIATLAAHLHAATYRLLVLIRAFDEREGWGGGGFRSCAHWLSWRTGISLGPCREKVRVAHALAELPRISEAMASGEMSFSKVRAMTRVATPANEEELLNVARHAPASQLERLVRAWRRVDRLEAAEQEAERHRSRKLRLWRDEDGSWVLRGRLDPEVGAQFQAALEWAGEALYRRDAAAARDTGEGETSPEQRWADAVGLVVERAMAQRRLDEDEALPPLGRPDRFQVVVHVDAATLQRSEAEVPVDAAGIHSACDGAFGCEDPDGRGVSAEPWRCRNPDEEDGSAETCECGEENGGPAALYPESFHPETARRLACDATVWGIVHGSKGEVLDVGRRRRTVPPALRLAMEVRFGGRCCFPGCDCRYVEGHHIHPWENGGETKLSNLGALCAVHHRAVHEGGVRMEVGEDTEPRFFRPDGRLIPPVPPPPTLTETPVEELVETHADMGIRPHAWTPTPNWWGESIDLSWAVDALRMVGRDEPEPVVSIGTSPTGRDGCPSAG